MEKQQRWIDTVMGLYRDAIGQRIQERDAVAARVWSYGDTLGGLAARPALPADLKAEVISLLEILKAETMSGTVHRRVIAAIEKVKEVPNV